MIADYYSEAFDKEHKYGEEAVISPKTILFIPVRGNLRARIESERKIELLPDWNLKIREVPALFWSENLVLEDGKNYVFETKYVSNSHDILPPHYLETLPSIIRKRFLKKVPQGIHELANKLIGNEKESIEILQRFHDFVHEHEREENPTTGKPIEQLLKEYNEGGFFYGNCKEARDFFMALCDAKGYPTKRVDGKCLESGCHVWADVFVPIKGGYGLLPVDAALGYFGRHNPMNHLFFEHTPDMPSRLFLTALDFVRGKETPNNYKLSIEKID